MSGKDYKFLGDILNDEELRQISTYVRIKLESHLEGKQTIVENMKSQLTNSVANAEKKSFAVDRELQNTKSKLEMSEEFVEKLKNQLREAEEALQKSRHDFYETLEVKDSVTYELNVIKEKMSRFSTEKLDLTEMLDRKQDEIHSLQNELKTVCSKLQSNSEGRLETRVQSEELELKVISLQHQEKRMSQERQLYQKQIKALNDELNAKVNELLALRRDRTVQIFELQSSLEQKSEENGKYLEEMKHLKQVVDKKDKHIEGLAQRIREMQHFSAQLEEDYQNEITAQNNLIELHKQSSNELKKRNESLVEDIEGMQKLLQLAKEAHNELESTFNESQIRFSEQLNHSVEENSVLVKELSELKESSANTSRENIESEFERQYPLAANTKKLLGKNMSFTQIFNELVSVRQELDDQKSENVVLKEHLQHLANEAEENAPLLHRKIQEVQRALQNISELQNQLSSVMGEREQWLGEKDTLIRINKQFEREIQRYEHENRDLAKQIRALLKSVQEARGFTVSHEQDSQISSSDNYRDVPQELVTFKDIEELQTRNRELMNALRQTNEKLQKLEEDRTDEQRLALQRDLDEAVLQLSNLRAERRQQTEMVEAVVKQRDLYKMIASHSNPDQNQSQGSPVAFTSSPLSSANRVSAEEHNELKSNFEKIKKEYEKSREESCDRMKALMEANEKLREEMSNFKIEVAKTSSELSFTQERLQMFKTNSDQFQRENTLLRERNTILNENVKKHEQSLVLMRQEVLSANEKLNRYELNVESLKSERDLYRNNELKLLQENEIMIRNQENQNKLINTLQTVQNNLNQMESDSISHLKIQNTKLEKELSYLRNKCEKDETRHSEASVLWEKQIQEMQTRIDVEIDKYLKIHQELSECQTKVKNVENELSSLRGSNQTIGSETTGQTESDRALQSQLIVIREQYNEVQYEVKLLRDRLSNSQKATESLRTINSTLEERLNEQKLTNEEMQQKSNLIITEKESLNKSLTKDLNEFKDRFQRLNEEKTTLERDQKNVSQQYLDRINKLTNSLIDANASAEKATLNEKRALEDRNNQMAIASEAQTNYERELVQHSRDAQLINSLRKQLELFQNKVFEAEYAANKAQEQLAQTHERSTSEKKNIEENNQKIKEKCIDLEKINDTLNQQLELLNNRIISIQNNSSLPLLSKDESIENTNRLLEVIKFLRKEKEILQTQITALESEDSRNKLIVENMKKELEFIRKELQEEKVQSKTLMSNVSQHNEMVKKIEMINILSDSNALLRSEKMNLEQKCQELSNKLSQIDSEKLSKDIQELTSKVETKNAENMALREELKHWQKRTNSLVDQVSKTNPEDFKRLNEEKAKLQQQILNSNQEFNKLNVELEGQKNSRKSLEIQIQNLGSEVESKSKELKKVEDELSSLRAESTSAQNTIVQLRKVARKYKMQFDELKVEFDKLTQTKANATNAAEALDNSASASQLAEHLQKIEELNTKMKETDQQIEKLNNDLSQVTAEREVAKSQALEKEEKAKKIAFQAKQRLAAISTEKQNILKEKELLQQNVEELREKLKQMEQNVEESGLRMASIKSQFDAKAVRFEKELTEGQKTIEDLRSQLNRSTQQIQSQQQLQQTTAVVGVTSASVQTLSQSTSNPVRHSVHPQPATVQPLSAKSTPTASIRPLAVAPTLHRSGRNPNVSSRTATVATVQPTTEDSTSHQSVPQATVQPTQTVSQMAFVPPNSAQESEVITSQSEDLLEDMDPNGTAVQNEMPELIPQLSGPYIDEPNSSEPTTRDEVLPQTGQTYIPPRLEASEPSTSVKIDRIREKVTLKRTRRTSEEMTGSQSPKKSKPETEPEGVRPEDMPQTIPKEMQQKSRTVAEDDDDVIILESDDSDVEQRDPTTEHEEEEEDNADDEEDDDEEEEEYEEDNEVEDNEEFVGEDNDDYNEEEEEESHYDEEQNEEQSDDNDEDIEVVGVSDDMPEANPEEGEEPQQQSIRSETLSSEPIEPNVSTTMSSLAVTSVVTSSTESNPFIQIPTPIQRPFVGRQSFYLSHGQQSSAYDEGDGIVPSTPTLFVPRRGDSFADSLNSPRVPQGRFVFSSTIPEATPLSQLASEGTLGVDDTRMDLSQFDDNNGRSVPTTPLANSPAVDNSVHSTVQSIDIDTDSDPNFGVDPNVIETIVPTEFETENTDSSTAETENQESNKSATNSADNEAIDVIDVDGDQRAEQLTETHTQESAKEENDSNKDETQIVFESESLPTSTSPSTSSHRGVPTARRGRVIGSQRGLLHRRPIMPPASEATPDMPNRPTAPQNVTQTQQQIQSSQQSGRTIRLRDSKFSTTRGNFRGRPSRGGPRGGYHYNN